MDELLAYNRKNIRQSSMKPCLIVVCRKMKQKLHIVI